jgi:hypothetical protein
MTATPADVPAALRRALREHFTQTQLVEPAAAVAWENYRSPL